MGGAGILGQNADLRGSELQAPSRHWILGSVAAASRSQAVGQLVRSQQPVSSTSLVTTNSTSHRPWARAAARKALKGNVGRLRSKQSRQAHLLAGQFQCWPQPVTSLTTYLTPSSPPRASGARSFESKL